MKQFIIENWASLLVIVLFFGYILYLVINKRWEQLRVTAYKLIRQAERVFVGTKRGQEKFNFVLDRLYTLIPGWLQFFVDRETLKEKLQEWYNHVKDYLDDAKINNSFQPPGEDPTGNETNSFPII
jgi:hypothetical protein